MTEATDPLTHTELIEIWHRVFDLKDTTTPGSEEAVACYNLLNAIRDLLRVHWEYNRMPLRSDGEGRKTAYDDGYDTGAKFRVMEEQGWNPGNTYLALLNEHNDEQWAFGFNAGVTGSSKESQDSSRSDLRTSN